MKKASPPFKERLYILWQSFWVIILRLGNKVEIHIGFSMCYLQFH